MNTIKLITIQQKKIVDKIMSGIYTSHIKHVVENRKLAYEILKTTYNYKNYPIFCVAVGSYGEVSGISDKETVMIELEVPENMCNFQDFYNWSDIIYFTEAKDEWNGNDYPFEKFCNDVLYDTKQNIDSKERALQVTIPFIKKEWIVSINTTPDKFINLHEYSGGKNKIMEVKEYL